ncbi:hypothetical protein Q1695_007054 [Nippostrongylus brasiliensis]|nr:hypothetical protein Q1695_007054 [Nippostrongylus brasiliensis]
MTSALSVRQGILTRTGNRLSSILKEQSELLALRLDAPIEDAEQREQRKDLRGRIRNTRTTIASEVDKLEDALDKYASAADRLDEETPSISEILQRTEEHIAIAQQILDNGHLALTSLSNLQEELEGSVGDTTVMDHTPTTQPNLKTNMDEKSKKATSQPKKPPLTAPKTTTPTVIGKSADSTVKKATSANPENSRKRRSSSSTSSSTSSSSDNTPVMKKSCSSGTLLKQLLQQGSKILLTAAAKVDQFAPATVSSSEALDRIEKLEQTVRKHHEQTTSLLIEIKSIVASLREMPATLKAVEDKAAANAKTSEVVENRNALGIRLDEILMQLKERHEFSSLPDFTKMEANIEIIVRRLSALEKKATFTAQAATVRDQNEHTPRRSKEDNEQRRQDECRRSGDGERTSRTTMDQSSRKQDESRLQGLFDRTKDELQKIREEIVSVNAAIEKEWANEDIREATSEKQLGATEGETISASRQGVDT